MIRINEMMKREIGEALFHISNEPTLDLSAVTITHVVTSRSLRAARVLVSIRDHKGEREKILRILARHKPEIQERINANLVLKFTPRLSFELDTSVERGDHILSLLSRLEEEQRTEEEGEAASPASVPEK